MYSKKQGLHTSNNFSVGCGFQFRRVYANHTFGVYERLLVPKTKYRFHQFICQILVLGNFWNRKRYFHHFGQFCMKIGL